MLRNIIVMSLSLVASEVAANAKDISLLKVSVSWWKVVDEKTNIKFLGYSLGVSPKDGDNIEITSCVDSSIKKTIKAGPEVKDSGPCDGSDDGGVFAYLVRGKIATILDAAISVRISTGDVISLPVDAAQRDALNSAKVNQDVLLAPTGSLVGKSESTVSDALKLIVGQTHDKIDGAVGDRFELRLFP